MKLACCAALFAMTCGAFAQGSPDEDFVLSGATAYGMFGAEPIVGSTASNLQWSDDGKYLLVERMDIGPASMVRLLLNQRGGVPPDIEGSVLVYSLADRKSTVVWRSKMTAGMLQKVQWFKESDTAIAIVVERLRTTDPAHPNPMRGHALFIDARAGTSKVILSVDMENGAPEMDVHLSPTKPFGLLSVQSMDRRSKPEEHAAWHFQYRTIQADGAIGQQMKIDDGAFVSGWSEDGVSPFLVSLGSDSTGKKWRKEQSIDLATGALSETKAPGIYKPQPVKAPISAGPGSGTAGLQNAKRNLHSFWLVSASGEGQAMIASDVTEVQLSPKLDAVAYVSQGVAMVRPIVQVPKEVFLLARAAADKARVISNAKQVGLAVLMYSMDMDDTLPGTSSDIGALIDPYLKNPSTFAGFVYTFTGGLIKDVKEPANTVIGYMPGPGGKAVVYVDGHVVWKIDQ